MIQSLKMRGFLISTAVGALAFLFLVLKMQPADMATLCQFFFIYQGAVTGGFFGFRFGEQWANSRKLEHNG